MTDKPQGRTRRVPANAPTDRATNETGNTTATLPAAAASLASTAAASPAEGVGGAGDASPTTSSPVANQQPRIAMEEPRKHYSQRYQPPADAPADFGDASTKDAARRVQAAVAAERAAVARSREDALRKPPMDEEILAKADPKRPMTLHELNAQMKLTRASTRDIVRDATREAAKAVGAALQEKIGSTGIARRHRKAGALQAAMAQLTTSSDNVSA